MYTCEVESSVPIPMEAGAYSIPLKERAYAACEAAKMLSELGMPEGEVDKETGQALLMGVAKDTPPTAAAAKNYLSVPANAMYLGKLLSEYDMIVVRDAAQLRTYVTNRLVAESDNPDARIRIQALKMLGQITDVGLFTEKTEITINNKAGSELESILRAKLDKLSGKVDAVDAVEIERTIKVIDLDEEFGL